MMHKPNILSNTSDQAPKNIQTKYQARIDAMKNEIFNAFDRFIDLDGDEKVTDWLQINGNKLPLEGLNSLPEGKSLSIELKREKKSESQGWSTAVGAPRKPELISSLRGKLISKEKDLPKAGDITTYLTITKKPTNPRFPENRDFEIKVEQVEFPPKNALIAEGLVFYNELRGDEFLKFTSSLELD